MKIYGVYARVNKGGCIIEINSDAFIDDITGWVKVDEGSGDKYHHAQGNYLPKPIMDEREIYRYKLENGIIRERTINEMFRTLRFVVRDENIEKDPDCDFAGIYPGTRGYLRAEFEFDKKWNGMNKAASFYNENDVEYASALRNNACMIPESALTGMLFRVSVTGAKAGKRIKTNQVVVKQGGRNGDCG